MSRKRKAFITGGGRGIGAAIAKELARRGFEIWAPVRAELDLADPASIKRFTEAHRADVDVLVNNAGINFLKAIPELDSAVWMQMQQVNLAAPLALIQWAVPFMREHAWGRILNISSIFGIVTKEKRSAYSMTKAALNALTRSAAVEFGPDGVLVNSLCPGYVDTEMTSRNNSPADLEKIKSAIPLRRLAVPEELASVAGFLCSEENNYITGQAVVADGGFSCQ
ncbi:MAG TPA: SDR family oxidoreductase [Verrucomicrobiae bacterium]|jgi:3-oxoacyl-[acyl-carrier protein] reductase|nr:SDR family oxidoreductase [Verrucomicrobiae bacterium]